MRNGTHVFSTDLMGVGQKSYFYEVNELAPEDIDYVRDLFLNDVSESVSSIYDRLFSLFSMVEQIDKLAVNDLNSDLAALKTNYAKNLEEEIQSEIESQGDKCLASLLEDDVTFFESEQGAAHFLNYICMQYIRTRKQQEAIVNGFSGAHKDQIVKCINLIRIVFSTKLAANLFADRQNYKLVLVNNTSNVDLLACDQPVINFMSIDTPEGEQVDNFGLYYPISPSKAVFLVERDVFGSTESMGFNEKSVHEYNNMILQSAHEQVYATSEEQLRNVIAKET